jgi:hypothetical protein
MSSSRSEASGRDVQDKRSLRSNSRAPPIVELKSASRGKGNNGTGSKKDEAKSSRPSSKSEESQPIVSPTSPSFSAVDTDITGSNVQMHGSKPMIVSITLENERPSGSETSPFTVIQKEATTPVGRVHSPALSLEEAANFTSTYFMETLGDNTDIGHAHRLARELSGVQGKILPIDTNLWDMKSTTLDEASVFERDYVSKHESALEKADEKEVLQQAEKLLEEANQQRLLMLPALYKELEAIAEIIFTQQKPKKKLQERFDLIAGQFMTLRRPGKTESSFTYVEKLVSVVRRPKGLEQAKSAKTARSEADADDLSTYSSTLSAEEETYQFIMASRAEEINEEREKERIQREIIRKVYKTIVKSFDA